MQSWTEQKLKQNNKTKKERTDACSIDTKLDLFGKPSTHLPGRRHGGSSPQARGRTSSRVSDGRCEELAPAESHDVSCLMFILCTRSRTLLGAPGIATRNKDATRGSWPYY